MGYSSSKLSQGDNRLSRDNQPEAKPLNSKTFNELIRKKLETGFDMDDARTNHTLINEYISKNRSSFNKDQRSIYTDLQAAIAQAQLLCVRGRGSGDNKLRKQAAEDFKEAYNACLDLLVTGKCDYKPKASTSENAFKARATTEKGTTGIDVPATDTSNFTVKKTNLKERFEKCPKIDRTSLESFKKSVFEYTAYVLKHDLNQDADNTILALMKIIEQKLKNKNSTANKGDKADKSTNNEVVPDISQLYTYVQRLKQGKIPDIDKTTLASFQIGLETYIGLNIADLNQEQAEYLLSDWDLILKRLEELKKLDPDALKQPINILEDEDNKIDLHHDMARFFARVARDKRGHNLSIGENLEEEALFRAESITNNVKAKYIKLVNSEINPKFAHLKLSDVETLHKDFSKIIEFESALNKQLAELESKVKSHEEDVIEAVKVKFGTSGDKIIDFKDAIDNFTTIVDDDQFDKNIALLRFKHANDKNLSNDLSREINAIRELKPLLLFDVWTKSNQKEGKVARGSVMG